MAGDGAEIGSVKNDFALAGVAAADGFMSDCVKHFLKPPFSFSPCLAFIGAPGLAALDKRQAAGFWGIKSASPSGAVK
jgi:hypothetical protein